MTRKNQSAAEYLQSQDQLMRIILGEMVQNAADANVHWDAAQRLVDTNPEAAMKHLAEAWVALKTSIKIERIDGLRVIDRTMELLDRELPDDDEPRAPRDIGVAD